MPRQGDTLKWCRVSAFWNVDHEIDRRIEKGAVYIGSEEKKRYETMFNQALAFGSCGGASGPSCARQFTITPTAATRPQQVNTHAHLFKRDALVAPQFLSFNLSFVPLDTYKCHSISQSYPRISRATQHRAPRTSRSCSLRNQPIPVMSLAINTSRPLVSSPLASPTSPSRQAARTLPIRKSSFPASRPLRPFPSITTAAVVNGTRGATKKPVKIIEPPKNYSGGCFVLNLTQAELSRQE